MKERIEELARGLFNPLSRDRYLTDKEMAMIAERIAIAVNEALELAALECDARNDVDSAAAIRNLKVK